MARTATAAAAAITAAVLLKLPGHLLYLLYMIHALSDDDDGYVLVHVVQEPCRTNTIIDTRTYVRTFNVYVPVLAQHVFSMV